MDKGNSCFTQIITIRCCCKLLISSLILNLVLALLLATGCCCRGGCKTSLADEKVDLMSDTDVAYFDGRAESHDNRAKRYAAQASMLVGAGSEDTPLSRSRRKNQTSVFSVSARPRNTRRVRARGRVMPRGGGLPPNAQYRIKSILQWYLSIHDGGARGVRQEGSASLFQYGSPVEVEHNCVNSSTDCETFLSYVDLHSRDSKLYLCMSTDGSLYTTSADNAKSSSQTTKDCLFEKIVVEKRKSENPIFLLASVKRQNDRPKYKLKRTNNRNCRKSKKKRRKSDSGRSKRSDMDKERKRKKTREKCWDLLTSRSFLCIDGEGQVYTRDRPNVVQGCKYIDLPIDPNG